MWDKNSSAGKSRLLAQRIFSRSRNEEMPSSDLTKIGSGLLEKHIRAARSQLPWNASRPDRLVVESCIKFLASQCDGAIAKDRKGFSIPDAPDGHKIAAKLWGKIPLSVKDRSDGIHYLKKYHKQLYVPYGIEAVEHLRKKPVFASELVDTPVGFVHPHISFNEDTGKCTVCLPLDIPQADRWDTIGDLRELFILSGTTQRDANNFNKTWKKIDWSAPGLSYHVADQGTAKLTRLLEQIGFAVDRRIEKALRKEMPPLMKAGIHKFNDSLKGLACTIQARSADSTLKSDLEAFVHGLNHPSVRLDWNDRLKRGTFAVGENIIPDLKIFCETQNVVGFVSIQELLADPSVQKYQWPKFKIERGELEKTETTEKTYSRPKWK